MNLRHLEPLLLELAGEHSVDAVLNRIVEALAADRDVALARIWLLDQPVVCDPDAPPPSRDLVLVASDGHSVDDEVPRWRSLEGNFSRFALGDRKVGRVAATGEPLYINNVGDAPEWMADPEWGKQERIRSFAGQPLVFRGEILGTLAIFGRTVLDERALLLLSSFAGHAAASIANARAFEEIDCLRRQLELENAYLREEVREATHHGDILGASSAIQKVLNQIRLVAPTESTVLIEGESGTGKELIARAIHDQSDRAGRPLVRVNCASIPKELFESEFFGHVKGAFTGAIKDRVGRFELADGGTLFLDEVGEIPMDLQSKLLRVLQEGEFERVGEEHTRSVDVRVIAATNRDLKREVDAGRFREDLFYRLSVFPLESPPLRARPEDIPLLAEHFLAEACRRLGFPAPALKRRHIAELTRYTWPGNVRELQNVLERAAITAQDGALRFDLPADAADTRTAAIPDREHDDGRVLSYDELRGLERDNIREALKRTDGKVSGKGGAAELLGVRPTTLFSRIKALNVPRPEKEAS